jgi:hypothetical protein
MVISHFARKRRGSKMEKLATKGKNENKKTAAS